jgi:hypothetical protein
MRSWQSEVTTSLPRAAPAPAAAALVTPGPDNRIAVYRLFLLGTGIVVLTKVVEVAVFGNIDFNIDPWSFLGLFAGQVLYDSSGIAVRAALIVGIAVTIALLSVFPWLSINAPALGLAAGSGMSLLARLCAVREQRREMSFILTLGLLMPLAHQICLFSQRMTTLHAETYDHRAFLVDASLGFSPAAAFAHADLLGFMASGFVIVTVYTSLTFMMTVVILWKIRTADRSWMQALTAFVLAGVLGTALYHVFPVAGPRFAFADGVPDPRTISSAMAFLDQDVVRNGMPSLHTAWAFLIMLNVAGLPKWFRCFTVFYFAAMLLATLATGQHFLIDLIVALPFAVAVQAVTLQLWHRKGAYAPFWFGTLATAMWLFLLKDHVDLFLNTPGFTATGMALTVTATVLATRRLTCIP